jgi:hypothetical protein
VIASPTAAAVTEPGTSSAAHPTAPRGERRKPNGETAVGRARRVNSVMEVIFRA